MTALHLPADRLFQTVEITDWRSACFLQVSGSQLRHRNNAVRLSQTPNVTKDDRLWLCSLGNQVAARINRKFLVEAFPGTSRNAPLLTSRDAFEIIDFVEFSFLSITGRTRASSRR
jgi:hypothetical protein